MALAPDRPQHLSVLWLTPVRDDIERGDEAVDLLDPVVQGRDGRDDEEGAPEVVLFRQVCEEGD